MDPTAASAMTPSLSPAAAEGVPIIRSASSPTRPRRSKVVVRVPATSANMGPGFDCLGMAVDIWNEVTVERSLEFSLENIGIAEFLQEVEMEMQKDINPQIKK